MCCLEILSIIWEQLWAITVTSELMDLVDIVIVAFLIFRSIELMHDTRAAQLIQGVFVILFLFVVAEFFQLKMLEAIIKFILTYGVLALLILFQPELRTLLEQMGRTSLSGIKQSILSGANSDEEVQKREMKEAVEQIVESCSGLSSTLTGALIVIECKTKIGDVISTGTLIDAHISKEIISNIFYHNAPLHDGAMVIRDGRVHSAGCFLPLSQNYEISNMLGTRHRAALGMSEVSDSIIIVVSEETGGITVARNGKLNQNLSVSVLNIMLSNMLVPEEKAPAKNKTTYPAWLRRKSK